MLAGVLLGTASTPSGTEDLSAKQVLPEKHSDNTQILRTICSRLIIL